MLYRRQYRKGEREREQATERKRAGVENKTGEKPLSFSAKSVGVLLRASCVSSMGKSGK